MGYYKYLSLSNKLEVFSMRVIESIDWVNYKYWVDAGMSQLIALKRVKDSTRYQKLRVLVMSNARKNKSLNDKQI